MDPSPELRAMLSRRLRKIEGAGAEVAFESARKSLVKEQVPVQPLNHGTFFFRSITGSSDEGSNQQRREGGPLMQRRRVRVPSWVHEGAEPPGQPRRLLAPPQQGQWQLQRQGSSASSNRSAPDDASAGPGDGLQRRVRAAQLDRDEALRASLEAEVGDAERGAGLEAEAQRLRQLALSLREELAAARAEVAARRREAECLASTAHACRLSSSDAAAVGSGGVRAAALAESRQLAEELCGQAQQRSTLQVRISGLSAELERQAAGRRQLQQQLESRRESEEALQRRLEAVCAEHAHSAEPSTSSTSSPPRTVVPGIPDHWTPQALPPPEARYNLDDGAPEAAASDLEFAYDWGLDLSGRMSVERALELARWAARAAGAGSAMEGAAGGSEEATLAPDASNAEDLSFEGPLAELQRALLVLSGAVEHRVSEGEAAQEETEATNFDEPIANLQLALSRLGQPSQEQEERSLEAFETEIENLQQAISWLSSKREDSFEQPALAEAQELDAFAGPMAELQEALAKLGAVEGAPHTESEAGVATPVTAPLAIAETPSGGAWLGEQGGGGPPEALFKAAAEGELDLGGPRELPEATTAFLSAFGSLGPAQALIRQKYARSDFRGRM